MFFVMVFRGLRGPDNVLGSKKPLLPATVATGICSLLVLYLVYQKSKKYEEPASPELPAEKLSGKALWFFFISLMNLLSTKITMLILPSFAPEAAIGIFNISYRFADLLIFRLLLMHTVLPQLFAPHVATGTAY